MASRTLIPAAIGLGLVASLASQSVTRERQNAGPAQASSPAPVQAPIAPRQVGSSFAGSSAFKGSGGLLAGVANGSSVNPGGVLLVDGASFTGTLLGDATLSGGLSGLTATPDGKLWGAARNGFGAGTTLLDIDPATGSAGTSLPILSGGQPVRVSDLATQPGTGTVYACGNVEGGTFGSIFTIDTATGAATLLGTTFGYDGGLAFAPDGTLWLISASVANPNLHTLDPATGAVLTTLGYGPDVGLDGLAVRPSDGALLATRGGFSGGDLIVEVNAFNGLTTPLGSTGAGQASDLAFLEGCDELADNGAWTFLGENMTVGSFFTGEWCFDYPYPVRLTVTDYAVCTDRYEVYDDGAFVAASSNLPDWDELGFGSPFEAPPFELDPNLALASGFFSSAVIEFAPGPHTITLRNTNIPPQSIGGDPFPDATAAIKLEPVCSPLAAVPGAQRFGSPPHPGVIQPFSQDRIIVGAGPLSGIAPPDAEFLVPNPASTILISWSFSLAPADISLAFPLGPLLISITPPNPIATVQQVYAISSVVSAGVVPESCDLVGLPLFSQGGYVESDGTIWLTNAIDYVIGTH